MKSRRAAFELVLLLAAVGVAYVGQVRGQESLAWLAVGLAAALLVAHFQWKVTTPKAVKKERSKASRNSEVTPKAGLKQKELAKQEVREEKEGWQSEPYGRLVDRFTEYVNDYEYGRRPYRRLRLGWRLTLWGFASIAFLTVPFVLAMWAVEEDENRKRIANLESPCSAVDAEIAKRFDIAPQGNPRDSLEVGASNYCSWSSSSTNEFLAYSASYNPRDKSSGEDGGEFFIANKVAASASREAEDGVFDECTVSWRSYFGSTQATVRISLIGEVASKDSCVLARDWASALYPRLPR
ncbi:hypothetical protein ACQPYE_08455 [Actinosynnema sp. CA-299493]